MSSIGEGLFGKLPVYWAMAYGGHSGSKDTSLCSVYLFFFFYEEWDSLYVRRIPDFKYVVFDNSLVRPLGCLTITTLRKLNFFTWNLRWSGPNRYLLKGHWGRRHNHFAPVTPLVHPHPFNVGDPVYDGSRTKTYWTLDSYQKCNNLPTL